MVNLRPAYVWDCPECGIENFCRGIVPEMSDEDLEELRSEQGIQPWEDGDFVMMPDEVQCEACNRVFTAQHLKDA